MGNPTTCKVYIRYKPRNANVFVTFKVKIKPAFNFMWCFCYLLSTLIRYKLILEGNCWKNKHTWICSNVAAAVGSQIRASEASHSWLKAVLKSAPHWHLASNNGTATDRHWTTEHWFLIFSLLGQLLQILSNKGDLTYALYRYQVKKKWYNKMNVPFLKIQNPIHA